MRILMLVAALALVGAAPSHGLAASGKGGCAAAHGKSAKAPACAKVRTPPMITMCRDVLTHRFAKFGGPNAEPVPAN